MYVEYSYVVYLVVHVFLFYLEGRWSWSMVRAVYTVQCSDFVVHCRERLSDLIGVHALIAAMSVAQSILGATCDLMTDTTRDSPRSLMRRCIRNRQVTENAVQVFSRSAHFPPLGVRGCIYRGGERCVILVATLDLMIDVSFEKARRDD